MSVCGNTHCCIWKPEFVYAKARTCVSANTYLCRWKHVFVQAQTRIYLGGKGQTVLVCRLFCGASTVTSRFPHHVGTSVVMAGGVREAALRTRFRRQSGGQRLAVLANLYQNFVFLWWV